MCCVSSPSTALQSVARRIVGWVVTRAEKLHHSAATSRTPLQQAMLCAVLTSSACAHIKSSPAAPPRQQLQTNAGSSRRARRQQCSAAAWCAPHRAAANTAADRQQATVCEWHARAPCQEARRRTNINQRETHMSSQTATRMHHPCIMHGGNTVPALPKGCVQHVHTCVRTDPCPSIPALPSLPSSLPSRRPSPALQLHPYSAGGRQREAVDGAQRPPLAALALGRRLLACCPAVVAVAGRRRRHEAPLQLKCVTLQQLCEHQAHLLQREAAANALARAAAEGQVRGRVAGRQRLTALSCRDAGRGRARCAGRSRLSTQRAMHGSVMQGVPLLQRGSSRHPPPQRDMQARARPPALPAASALAGTRPRAATRPGRGAAHT